MVQKYVKKSNWQNLFSNYGNIKVLLHRQGVSING